MGTSFREFERITEKSLQGFPLSDGVGLFCWLEHIVEQTNDDEVSGTNPKDRDEDSYQWVRRCPYGGNALQFTNYVGLVPVGAGVFIEILPKIKLGPSEDEERRILFQMVCTLIEDVKPIKFEEENLLARNETPLYDRLVELFLHDVFCLVRHGVAKAYINLDGILPYLKGRLLFAEQVKRNKGLMNGFYTQHDEFLSDRLENRVIKAALLTVKKYSFNTRHLRIINELLAAFEGISANVHINEIKRTYCDREMKYYGKALKWSELILRNLSPTFLKTSKHSLKTPCLLFPMHRLFEAFVFKCLENQNNGDLVFEAQNTDHYLFVDESQTTQFKNQSLRPDIVVKHNGQTIAIMDSKWKKVTKDDLKISSADLYQMYVYGKKYFGQKSGVIFLIFPKNEEFTEVVGPVLFDNEPKLSLYLVPFDFKKKELCLGSSTLRTFLGYF